MNARLIVAVVKDLEHVLILWDLITVSVMMGIVWTSMKGHVLVSCTRLRLLYQNLSIKYVPKSQCKLMWEGEMLFIDGFFSSHL